MSDNLNEPYGWVSAAAPGSSEYLAKVVLEELKILGVRRVVDLGCGNGALCGFLQDAGFDVVGVEYDREGIERARKSFPKVEFHCMSVGDDPTPVLQGREKFDAAISTEVVEHLYSPHHLPQFAASLVKPNGYLLVSTPYHGYLKNLAIALLGKWDSHHSPLWHGGHIKFWSRKTLGQLLAAEGFDVLRFQGVGRLPWLWKSMVLTAKLRATTPTDGFR